MNDDATDADARIVICGHPGPHVGCPHDPAAAGDWVRLDLPSDGVTPSV